MTVTTRAERARLAIYRRLAETGTLPDKAGLANLLGEEPDAVLRELADAHHVVIRDGRIVLAHPFATQPFGFSVMGPNTLWWGGCAWDSFAIPHLVPGAAEVLVATTCPACATPHAWTVTNVTPPTGGQVAHFLVPTARIWDDVVHSCANQLIFCDSGCVTTWLERTGNDRGYEMSLTTLWQLAEHWYDGRLDSPYTRREPAEASEYFQSVGLSGAFWGLP